MYKIDSKNRPLGQTQNNYAHVIGNRRIVKKRIGRKHFLVYNVFKIQNLNY